MNFRLKMSTNALAFIALIPSFHCAIAGGTSVNGVGVRGSTFQAFSAVADDPSAIYYNPAGLTQLQGTNIQASVTYIAPNVKYQNGLVNVETKSTHSVFGPSFFMSTDKIPHITFGLGMYAPFARSLSYEENMATYNEALRGLLVRTDLVPTVAFDLGPYLSLGLGFVISKTQNETNMLGFHEASDGMGYTGQGGIMVKLPHQVKLGFTYRGPMTTHVSGTGTLMGMSNPYTGPIEFPGTYSFGASWQATKQFLLSAQFDEQTWSRMKAIERHFTNPMFNSVGGYIPINAYDSKAWRVGTSYKVTENDEMRLGYSYTQAAFPHESMVPIQPECNYTGYTLGYSHRFGQWRLDGGYELNHLLKRQSINPFFPGMSKGVVHNVMAGFMYTFS